MKNPHRAPDEKVRIIMESINTRITPAELCRRHNISQITFSRWSESFIESCKAALSGKPRDNAVKTLTSENESLKKLIGDLTIVNDILKKNVTVEYKMKSVTLMQEQGLSLRKSARYAGASNKRLYAIKKPRTSKSTRKYQRWYRRLLKTDSHMEHEEWSPSYLALQVNL